MSAIISSGSRPSIVFLRMAPRVFTFCRVDGQDLGLVAIRVYAAQTGQLDVVGPLRGEESGAHVTPFCGLTSDTSVVGVGRSRSILVSSSRELLVQRPFHEDLTVDPRTVPQVHRQCT